jgi:hypothetical protein
MLLLVRVTLAIIGRFQFGAQVARAPPITDPFPSSFGALCLYIYIERYIYIYIYMSKINIHTHTLVH